MNDNTNPEHYKTHPSGIECIEITQHYDFNIGNAIKYLWRAGLKGSETEDLKKAIWYINNKIKLLEGVDKIREVICVCNMLTLTNGKLYVVVDSSDEYYTVVNDKGNEKSYKHSAFKIHEPK